MIAVVGSFESYRRWRKDNPDAEAFLVQASSDVRGRKIHDVLWLPDARYSRAVVQALEETRQITALEDEAKS